MQAIITKYLPPSYVKGVRIRATCEAMTIILSWDPGCGPEDHGHNPEDNHKAAAAELCLRMDKRCAKLYGSKPQWNKPKITAELKGGECVHVFIPEGHAILRQGAP